MVQLPEKDELSWSKKQLLARLDVSMGGRVAEEMVFGKENVTSGKRSTLCALSLPRFTVMVTVLFVYNAYVCQQQIVEA